MHDGNEGLIKIMCVFLSKMTSIFRNTLAKMYYTSILETDINENIVKVPLKKIKNKTISKD